MNTLIYNKDTRELVIVRDEFKWIEPNLDPPELGFQYDFLFYEPTQRCKYIAGKNIPLIQDEMDLIESFIATLTPSINGVNVEGVPFEDISDKLKQVNSILYRIHYSIYLTLDKLSTNLRYRNMSDVLICGRVDSKDKYANEARRLLEFSDFLWNKFYDIRDEVDRIYKSEEDMPDFTHFEAMLPPIPNLKYFETGE